MKPTANDKLIAYLTLFSGLAISGVAEYYSIMGLIAIYPAAVIPIIIMGIVLGLGKISGTVWLKQNWEFAPWFLKTYILPAVVVLMLITSLGVFGFLSKAHSDQSLVSGDVQSKIAIYDEKIKTAKENIESNRKQLKQMDEAVDQVMARSSDEKGADKANAIRKNQSRDRVALAKDIEANQKLVIQLNDEAAPIRAEVRKVEAEVGPIKYIAHLLYGENPDANILEKAVIWVTVLIVVVLDPLAVILLLASQFSFQRFREQDEDQEVKDWFDRGRERARELDEEADAILKQGVTNSDSNDNVGVVAQELAEAVPEAVIKEFEGVKDPVTGEWIQTGPEFTTVGAGQFGIPVEQYHELLKQATIELQEKARDLEAKYEADEGALTEDQLEQIKQSSVPVEELPDHGVHIVEPDIKYTFVSEDQEPDYVEPVIASTEETVVTPTQHIVEHPNGEYVTIDGQTFHRNAIPAGYIQNEEQTQSNLWSTVGNPITQQEYFEKAKNNNS
jgi:energy-converting hydrogenase Eha subunit A